MWGVFVLSGLCAAVLGVVISFVVANRRLIGGMIGDAAGRYLPDDMFHWGSPGERRRDAARPTRPGRVDFGIHHWAWLLIGILAAKVCDAIIWVLLNDYDGLCRMVCPAP